MDYRVRITQRAISDAEDVHEWIFDESPERAFSWFSGLLGAIYGLSVFPTRCPLALESRDLPIEVRQLLYGKRGGVYRILFHIQEEEKTVIVLRIRHSARLSLHPDELFDGD